MVATIVYMAFSDYTTWPENVAEFMLAICSNYGNVGFYFGGSWTSLLP